MKFPNADFFFSCDARITLKRAWNYLPEHKCKVVLAKGGSGFNCYQATRGVRIEDEIDEDRLMYPNRVKTDLFDKANGNLIWGTSSAHPAAHFLYNMGCETIVLLGCDCSSEAGKFYYWEFPGQPQGGFINKDYEDVALKEPFLGDIFNTTWENIACKNPIKLINCSAGKIKGIENKKLEEL
jgi:hypothetical protein